MKSILFSFCILFSFTFLYSQNSYEKGYYISNNGIKTEGYLKIVNFEDVNSFENIEFKKEFEGNKINVSTNNILEFGIGSELKHQKVVVEMDDVDLFKSIIICC